MRMTRHFFKKVIVSLLCTGISIGLHAQEEDIRVLIIDGQSNHGIWPKTTMMMKDYLEETGLFTVDIQRTKYVWLGPHSQMNEEELQELFAAYPLNGNEGYEALPKPKADPDYTPDFSKYDVVISNFGWQAAPWPEATNTAFESFMREGGGLVVIHAANNCFGDWHAYNRMIGLGGWGGRDVNSGPYVYYNDAGELIRDPQEGDCGSHGPRQEVLITVRDTDHPITKGMPMQWLHTEDEIYDRLRGPAEEMNILATAYSDVEGNAPPWNDKVKGTGRHEPMLMTIDYHQGRIFHITLGHSDLSMECAGLITALRRGTEWVATGAVTQEIPADFPGDQEVSRRAWNK